MIDTMFSFAFLGKFWLSWNSVEHSKRWRFWNPYICKANLEQKKKNRKVVDDEYFKKKGLKRLKKKKQINGK